jgi:hypothetical protein
MAPAVIAVVAVALVAYWPHVRNEFFVLLGSRDEAGGWYGFHSGAGGAAWMGVIPAMALFYWHGTCHHSAACLRWGKYEAAGGMFKLCRHHHPDLQGSRPHGDLIHRLHAEHKARQQP